MNDPELIVIENTRSCNLRCAGCPTVHSADYANEFMSMDTFRAVLNNIEGTGFSKCALMGWGEPFLDPTYFDKLALLRDRDLKVGSTTNLLLVDEDKVRRLVDLELSQLVVSLDVQHLRAAGMTEAEAAKKLGMTTGIIARAGTGPLVGITVVVGRGSEEQVRGIVNAVRELPLSGISLVPYIMIPSRAIFEQLIPATEYRAFREELKASYEGPSLSFSYLDEPPKANCRSDIFRNVYAGYNGRLSPCCVLAMEFPNFTFDGGQHRTERLAFGDLGAERFEEIWDSRPYREFRERFARGEHPDICECCNAWRKLP